MTSIIKQRLRVNSIIFLRWLHGLFSEEGDFVDLIDIQWTFAALHAHAFD